MELELSKIIPCSGTTERSYRSAISVANSVVLYCSENIIAILNFENLDESDAFRGHSRKTCYVKASPNGSWAASADEGGQILIWGISNKNHPIKLETSVSGIIRDIAWSPDSERLVVVGEGVAKAFIMETGSSIGEFSGHSRSILTADFRPVRPFRIVTGGEDFQVNLYSGPPFRYQSHKKDHTSYVNCVKISPDGNKFASASKKVIVYELESLEIQYVLEGHTGSILGCEWIDEESLITVSMDSSIKIWRSSELTKSIDWDSPLVGVWTNGIKFIVMDLKGFLSFWNLETESLVTVYKSTVKPPKKIVFNNTGELFAADSAGYVISRKEETGDLVFQHGSAVVTLCSHKELPFVASLSLEAKVCIINTGSEEKTVFELEETPIDGDWDPNEPILFVLTKTKLFEWNDGSIKSLDLVSPASILGVTSTFFYLYTTRIEGMNRLLEVNATTEPFVCSAFTISNSGNQLAAAEEHHSIFLYQIPDLVFEKRFDFHTSRVSEIEFNLEESLMVSGSLDKSVVIWNIESGTRNVVRDAHRPGVNSVAFNSENEVFSCGTDNTIKKWIIL